MLYTLCRPSPTRRGSSWGGAPWKCCCASASASWPPPQPCWWCRTSWWCTGGEYDCKQPQPQFFFNFFSFGWFFNSHVFLLHQAKPWKYYMITHVLYDEVLYDMYRAIADPTLQRRASCRRRAVYPARELAVFVIFHHFFFAWFPCIYFTF